MENNNVVLIQDTFDPITNNGEWVILYDYFENEEVGTFGNCRGVLCRGNKEKAEKFYLAVKSKWYQFRIYDDDGFLYYAGECTDNSSFEPKDFAMANVGATEIRYFENGVWVRL